MAEETLRPTAAGDSTALTPYPGTGEANWQDVDDVTSDNDSTYVNAGSYDAWLLDLYNLANHSVGSGVINYVTIYMVSYITASGSKAKIAVKTHGTVYYGDEFYDTSYTLRSKQYTANPYTSSAWTWDEVDALQAGVDLYAISSKGVAHCTQVYIIVTYGLVSPIATTQDATGVGATSATLNGTIESVGGVNADERGFEYSPIWLTPDGVDDGGGYWNIPPNLIDNDINTWCANEEAPYTEYGHYVEFSLDIAFLVTGFRVYVPVLAEVCKKLSVDFYYSGAWYNVYENINMNTVGWYEVTGLAEHSVTKARVKIASEGDSIVPYLGEFDFYVAPTSWTESGSYGVGAFSHGVTGLATGYTYYFRAKAHNSYGWGYGDWKSFIAQVAAAVELGADYQLLNLGVKVY